MALSPISPQELFLAPISSDTDAGQQQNQVRHINVCLWAVFLRPFDMRPIMFNRDMNKNIYCIGFDRWALINFNRASSNKR